MSESQNDEILTGRQGIEASQGYTTMPGPSAPEPAVDNSIDIDTAVAERTSPEFAVTSRQYVDLGDGSPRPDNETVELDRAVVDLGARRAQEFELLEALKAEQLRQRVEILKSPVADEVRKAQAGMWARSAEEIAALPIEQQIAALEELQRKQLEQPQPQAGQQPEAQAAEQPTPGQQAAYQELSELFQRRPELIQVFEAQRQQDLAQGHQAVQAAEKWIQDSAAQATAGVFLSFPELANLGINELPIALSMMQKQNPERFAQAMHHINGIQKILEQSRFVQAQQQQRAQQNYQREWQKFSGDEDSKFIQRAPEMADSATASAITNKAVNYLRSLGFSDGDLHRAYNGDASVSLRDHRMQLLIRDAVRYHDAVNSVPQARRNAPTRVQKPGPSGTIARQEDLDMRAISNQLNGATGNAAARLGARIIEERRARTKGR
jgi:hypothetical protein